MKTLDKITEAERAALFPIILSEYNPAWANWFADEKERLIQLIGCEQIVRITHYGSTAVRGLTAKPTVDILLEIDENTDVEKLIASLPSPEYICLRQPTTPNSTPPHLMFLKGYTSTGFAERVFHIHVRYPGDWDELYFRDYLINHPEVAAEYATLKRTLKDNYEYDRDGYTTAKSAFIQEITRQARNCCEIKRVTEQDDFIVLAKVLNEAFGTVAKDFGLTKENTPTNSAFITSDSLQAQLTEHREFYTCMMDGRYVGFVAIEKSLDTPDTFYIEKLAVIPTFRHQGIGCRLIHFATNRIKELGGKQISIALINGNTVLKQWYANLGYRETSIKTYEHLPFDVCFMNYRMKTF